MFKNLARDTCEGDGSVICSFLLRALPVHPDHIRGEPVLGQASTPKSFRNISVKICANSPECTP